MDLEKKMLALCIFAVLVLSSCVSMANFSDVEGKEWLLAEIRTKDGIVTIDRNELKSRGFSENIFSLTFGEGRVSGVSDPNRYFAPYMLGENQSISIREIAGTLMAPLFEPEELKENEFFVYLRNAYKWDYVKGRLELYTKNEKGVETVLVFD